MNRILSTQLKYTHNYSRLINNPKSTNGFFVRNRTKKPGTSRNIDFSELSNINSKILPYNHLFVTSKSKTSFITNNQSRTYSEINNKSNKLETLEIIIGCILGVLGFVFVGIVFCFFCSFMIFFTIESVNNSLETLRRMCR